MHKQIKLKALYFGTPVVLISTRNEDKTSNLAPFSSAWWMGKSCVLGMSTRSKTFENLSRERELVINLPTPELVSNVNRLALVTGKDPVPDYKEKMGYRFESDKFELAGFNEIASLDVRASRVLECPVNLEAQVKQIHVVGSPDHNLAAIEVEIIQIHIDDYYLIPGTNYVDVEKWSPLIMNFCEFFGLTSVIHPSKLAEAWFPPSKNLDRKILTSN